MKQPNLEFNNQEHPFIKGIVAGALVTGVVFFFYLGGVILNEPSQSSDLASRKPAQSKRNDVVHKKAIALVNENLRMDQKLKELRALGVEVKNEEHLREIQQRLNDLEQSYDRNAGVEVIVDDGSAAVLEDIEEPVNQHDQAMTPEEKIEFQMMRNREIAAYEREQRLQYVRQFLENARKNGYDITLNDKLEVVRVKRVRKNEPFRGEDSINDLFQ